MIADCVTVSRALMSLAMLALSPRSGVFAAMYLLCGASDALDGFLARRLRTQSERGAALDSAADALFSLVYAVRILPRMSLPIWVFVWIALIFAIRAAGVAVSAGKGNGILLEHSLPNRLTGAAVFLLPITARFVRPIYGAAFACAVATFSAVYETYGRARDEQI